MVKKFTVNCDFGGQIAPFTIYLGEPEKEHHPLHFQAEWLSKTRGGNIPGQVMDAVSKLKTLADKNKVSFEELCVYALGAAEQEMDDASQESSEVSQEQEQAPEEVPTAEGDEGS